MPSVKVTYSNLGLVRHVEGDTGIALGNYGRALQQGNSGAEVLEKFGDVLLASGEETLTVRLNMFRVVKLDQSIHGIPVLHGGVSLTIDEGTGIVRSIGAYFLPDHGLPREPKLSSAEATSVAIEMLEKQGIAKPGTVEVSTAPTMAYHGIFPTSTRGRLVWAVAAFYAAANTGDPSGGIYWIDAIDGEYVGMEPSSVSALNRPVSTANDGTLNPVVIPSCTTRR